MAKTYSFTEARQMLADVLDSAEREGEVRITRRNGKAFIVRPEESAGSPLDVPGVDTDITLQEITDTIREGREMDFHKRRSSSAK
jgi:prevent-host-death family protein